MEVTSLENGKMVGNTVMESTTIAMETYTKETG